MTPELLAQSPGITNWLTPVWLLSVGVSLGFLLVVLLLAKIWICSKIGWLAKLADGPLYPLWAGLLSVIYLAIGTLFFLWGWHNFELTKEAQKQLPLFLAFALPVSVLLGFGVWRLFSKQGSSESFLLVREGFLGWLNFICLGMMAFAAIGYFLALFGGFGIIKFVDQPYVLLNSATRLPMAGEFKVAKEVPPTEGKIGGTEIDVSFYGEEVRAVTVRTDQPLEIAAEPITPDLPPSQIFSVPASSEPRLFFRRPDGSGPIPNGLTETIYAINTGNSPAKLTFRWATLPIYPQVWLIPWAAVMTLMVYLLYLIFASLFPKIFAIAFSTFKTEINQPLFLVVLFIGFVFILGAIYVPYNTFGEDIKMYKDSGLTLIRVLAIFLAVWAASKSVAEEIEGRTALTVLSKPVGRRQFILGKFSGIALTAGLLFILLGIWFVIWTGYKPIYDGKESVSGTVEWEVAFGHAIGIVPALFLAFLEVLIFAAISVAISTRLGILANFLICFAVYVLGHLTPLLVQSSVGQFEIVQTFGNLIATVFPVLNHFDVQAAIHKSEAVELTYVSWATIYCALYSAIAMLIALVLFEDRDLA